MLINNSIATESVHASSYCNNAPDVITHHKSVEYKNSLFKLKNISNLQNINFTTLHDSLITDQMCNLFDIDLLVTSTESLSANMLDIKLHLNKHCMTELTLLDKTNILCLFDMGSTVNFSLNQPFFKALI